MGSVKEALIMVPCFVSYIYKRNADKKKQFFLKIKNISRIENFLTDFIIQNVGIHNVIDILHFIELNVH